VRSDDVLGCPINPERETRDKVLADAVARKLEGGLRYKAATYELQKEIEAQAKAESAAGAAAIRLVKEATIRAAYDKWSRRRGKP